MLAGVPFPNPAEPNLANKIFYNSWTVYQPAKGRYVTGTASLDRFGNNLPQRTEVILWRMNHISEEGVPNNPAYGKGWLQSNRFFVEAPNKPSIQPNWRCCPTILKNCRRSLSSCSPFAALCASRRRPGARQSSVPIGFRTITAMVCSYSRLRSR